MSHLEELARRTRDLPEPDYRALLRRAVGLGFTILNVGTPDKTYWLLWPIAGPDEAPEPPYPSLHLIDDQLRSYEREGVPHEYR